MIKLLLLTVFFWQYSFYSVAQTVKLYNWWNYISPEVLKDLKDNGIKLNLVTYTSNSQAISRIYNNRDSFDFVIISTSTLKALEAYDIFDKSTLKSIFKKRPYKLPISEEDYCLPYLWGPTVFVYKGLEKTSTEITSSSISEFIKQNIRVHIIDDPAEFFSMFQADETCDDYDCFVKEYTKLSKFLKPKNFKSEISQLNISDKYLFYGWLGAISELVAKKENQFKVKVPQRVVVGQDNLCLLKSSALSEKEKVKFAELITNEKNSKFNESFSGYYSPYLHEKESRRKTYLEEIKKNVLNKINAKEFIKIPSSQDKVFRKLHDGWMKVRYDE